MNDRDRDMWREAPRQRRFTRVNLPGADVRSWAPLRMERVRERIARRQQIWRVVCEGAWPATIGLLAILALGYWALWECSWLISASKHQMSAGAAFAAGCGFVPALVGFASLVWFLGRDWVTEWLGGIVR